MMLSVLTMLFDWFNYIPFMHVTVSLPPPPRCWVTLNSYGRHLPQEVTPRQSTFSRNLTIQLNSCRDYFAG